MAGLRIKDLLLSTTYKQAIADGASLAVDVDGYTEAKKVPVSLFGNTRIEGSFDGIVWSEDLDPTHTYLRFSTGVAGEYVVLDVVSVTEHPPLTLGASAGALSLDEENQILNLESAVTTSLEDLSDFPLGNPLEVFIRNSTGTGYQFIQLPHSYLSGFNDAIDYQHLTTAEKANLIQAATTETNGYMTLEQVTALEGKADEFTVGEGLILSAERELSLDLSSSIQSLGLVYTITLPADTTVAGRVLGAVEGTDYPTDWVLSEGSNPVDLNITHNLGKRIVSVTVFSVNGTEERQLFGNAAYSGILSPDSNTIRIESLATITKAIKIYLLVV